MDGMARMVAPRSREIRCMFGRMKSSWGQVGWAAAFFLVGPGCGESDRPPSPRNTREISTLCQSEGKTVKVGENVLLEVLPNARRVLVSSRVCLREGALELLLTRKGTKEHESILSADIDARNVHEALLLAGAESGSTVRFNPRYRPPTGTPIKISLIYREGARQVVVSARSWVRNSNTREELESNWVFAGSV